MSVSGCPLIVSSLIRTRPSCCGSERGTVCLNSQRGPCPVLQLGLDLITSSDYVRLLGATITSDLNLNRHVSVVSASCFYWLRQLWRTRRSLDQQSAATLVHAFVTSRVDYCNTLLAGAPKVTTDKLQRVFNAAARILTGIHKFDRGLSRLLHTELHSLDIPDRVTYKLGVIVFDCQHSRAPQCLIDYCPPASDVASRQHLRSATSLSSVTRWTRCLVNTGKDASLPVITRHRVHRVTDDRDVRCCR